MRAAEAVLEWIGKYRYLLLLLLFGLALILLPAGSGSKSAKNPASATATEARLEAVLSEVSGAGRVSVLCSEEGVAVVCEGANSASVRLDIVRAVCVYTGLGSDRVTVLRMEGTH